MENVTVKQETTRDLFIDIQGGVTVISSIEKKPQVLIIEPKNRTTVAKAIDDSYQKVEDENKRLESELTRLENDYSRVLEKATMSEMSKTNYDLEAVFKVIEDKQQEFYYGIIKDDFFQMIENGADLSEIKEYFSSINS